MITKQLFSIILISIILITLGLYVEAIRQVIEQYISTPSLLAFDIILISIIMLWLNKRKK